MTSYKKKIYNSKCSKRKHRGLHSIESVGRQVGCVVKDIKEKNNRQSNKKATKKIVKVKK